MKYTLICFTFNKKEAKEIITGEYLTLRNNWVDTVWNDFELDDLLGNFGFDASEIYDVFHKINNQPVTKLSGDFTLSDTRIIVHIIKN